MVLCAVFNSFCTCLDTGRVLVIADQFVWCYKTLSAPDELDAFVLSCKRSGRKPDFPRAGARVGAADLPPPLQYDDPQTHFALVAAGFTLLFWHRGQTKLHSLPGKQLLSQA